MKRPIFYFEVNANIFVNLNVYLHAQEFCLLLCACILCFFVKGTGVGDVQQLH